MSGCVMTFDALHAVKKTFCDVVETGGDFLVCVKNNAPDLRRRLNKHLEKNRENVLCAETEEKSHGRFEKRSIKMAALSPRQSGWPHTHLACMVQRERRQLRRGETVSQSSETVFYVASFNINKYSPEQVLDMIRRHWGVENALHHRKDRSMDEDRCRSASDKSGRIMCCIRSLAALVLDRAKETLNVVRRRLSKKTHLLLALLSCKTLNEWESKFKPYK